MRKKGDMSGEKRTFGHPNGRNVLSPPQFAQVYTIHALLNKHHVVGCYALLPNKTQETYLEMLRPVQQLTNGGSPQTIMIDFEQACISAIPNVFLNASVHGCLFHLGKSIFRRVQAHGFQQE